MSLSPRLASVDDPRSTRWRVAWQKPPPGARRSQPGQRRPTRMAFPSRKPADERRALWRRRIPFFAAVDRELTRELRRGLGRIAFEQGRATAACELVVGAAAADVYGPTAGELAQGSRGRR